MFREYIRYRRGHPSQVFHSSEVSEWRYEQRYKIQAFRKCALSARRLIAGRLCKDSIRRLLGYSAGRKEPFILLFRGEGEEEEERQQ